MSPAAQIALALGAVAALLGLMAVVRRLGQTLAIGAEVQRKLVHVATGLFALSLPWIFPERWPIYALLAVTLAVMAVLRRPGSRLGGTLHGVERHSYGDFLLAIAVGLCLFLAGDDLYLYVLPIAVLTLADAAAALAGSTYGRRIFRVEDGQKSVEGSVVFFTVTLLISIVCLMLMTALPPVNILLLSVMVAAFGTLVEAASWRGFDNLFLPLGLLILLSVHADDTIRQLLTLTALFAASIVGFMAVSRRLGLTRHAANVYVTAVFLLLAMTAVQNAILPILVLAAHAWARSAVPCDARYPDLDIVAALALVSFGWLALGEATGLSAIGFYGLTAAGMVAGLCAVALSRQGAAVRMGALAVVGAGVALLYALAVLSNPAASSWNGPMWTVLALCLGLGLLGPTLAPAAFATARVTRITLGALAVPLLAYGAAVTGVT